MGGVLFICGEPGSHTTTTGISEIAGTTAGLPNLLIGAAVLELAAVVLAGIGVGVILLLVRRSNRRPANHGLS